MRLPDLLATKRGRLLAFFLLYVAEGIPAGFTGTAVATQMRRQGLDPAAIGGFLSVLYIPWAFKWALGPFVDVVTVERWGRRRFWILLTQTLMAATVVAAMFVDLKTHLFLFTSVIFVLNVFSATQDVAIDALAVNSLHKEERGAANGLMFGGSFLGNAMGGAGVLLLTPWIGFRSTFLLVAAAILAITLLVAAPLREVVRADAIRAARGTLRDVGRAVGEFAREALGAFARSRPALAAVFLALLPMGPYALSFSVLSNLSVELGLNDQQVGLLSFLSAIIGASFCVLGGWISDRFGRRRSLAAFIAGMAVPTVLLAVVMARFGWWMPVDPTLTNRPAPPAELLSLFWGLTLLYAVFNGLMYGAGTAIYMDVTDPRVAATQFTAYMALCNVVYAYTPKWQGISLVRLGYPATLAIDTAFGLVCLLLVPLLKGQGPGKREEPAPGAAVPETVPS
ncbi:MAG TPA: MFS transporter [Candidatus Eisenbacteria bacterium]|nr:MFS transporter [Candidatus Eisenbacteria bacterium]